MKYAVILFLVALIWAAIVTLLTNTYLGGNLLLGAPIALVGGVGIGAGVALWLRRRFRKVRTGEW